MLKKTCILLGLICLTAAVYGQLPTQTFKTVDGKNFSFSASNPGKGYVLFFLLPDCPMCQNYSLTINQLDKKYSDKGFSFIVVFPGKANSNKEIQNYLKTYKMNITAITDPTFNISDALHATVTPQVILMNSKGKALYSGKIDNWMYAIGKNRQVVTEYYLKEALENVLQNKPVKRTNTEPVGCFIK